MSIFNFKKNTNLLIVLTLFFFVSFATQTHAATKELTGYAWSGNVDATSNKGIGWISFNCSNSNSCGTVAYKVLMDDLTGNLSGYAWSSNIGWISFNENSGCPLGGTNCAPKVDMNGTGLRPVSGWIRACSATATKNCQGALASDQSWDGWIELAGTNHTSLSGNGVGYNKNDGKFSGFAWGDEIVGWVKFDTGIKDVGCPTCTNNTSCTLQANVVPGQTDVNLTWTINNDSGSYALTRLPSTNILNTTGSGNTVDSNVPLRSYTYRLSRSGGATCTSNAVNVTDAPTSTTGKLWLGNNQNTVQVTMGTLDYVDVRWSIPEGAVCTTAQSTGASIPEWITKSVNSLTGVQRVKNLVEDKYTLGLSCTAGDGSPITINNVVIIVSDSELEEE